MIHVIKPGLLTTVQDLGRRGFTHLGVSPGGAADSVSFRIANLLVGNDWNAAALEITLLGPTLEFEVAATIAIAGYGTSTSLPINEAFEVAAGTTVAIGPLSAGARAYLAIRGGLSIPEVMDSCSTFLPARIGGLQGRALRAGDELVIGKRTLAGFRKLSPELAASFRLHQGPIRVTPSLQSDWFDPETVERFHQKPFTVTDQSNRSGLRLAGETILAPHRGELLTQGIALGAVQVPPDGQPIILFVDQQTTGGYPKIANVIAADLPRVGQLRPGDEIRFQPVKIPEAIELLRQQERALREAFALGDSHAPDDDRS
jgi:antagonist of KipI